ncbi:zinc-binding dehydrogenase [Actinoplanes sp. M2I2]|uniref:zinc-dependent alcohol dehydrogenase n=1 Tax=Actinoplanes sp. M2I2 TaxID=1734444 RepID=UPI0020210393|nr:alcohol dehydrogenase catalytic domain-containing protein [Actinoplanes sp. M2I2]
MKALVKTAAGPGHLELADVPEPQAKPGWVVLAVRYGGICGTDLHIEADRHPYYPPVVLGHEFVGVVASVGPEVTGWSAGDRVVCEPHALFCGRCEQCRRGLVRLCASKRAPGWGIDGAFAPFVAVPAALLHRVPDEVPDERAAVCEPAAVAARALNRVGIVPGDRVAVLGPGPIGILAALQAAARGADRTVLIGRDPGSARMRTAAELGVECATDLVGEVDVVVDTTGSSAAVTAGIGALRRAGRLVTVGVGDETFAVPWRDALFRSVDVKFSFSSAYEDWRGVLSLMRRGALPAERLTTVFDLADWERAFAAVADRRVTKALVRP